MNYRGRYNNDVLALQITIIKKNKWSAVNEPR